MSLFLKEAWIERTSREQLVEGAGRHLVASHAQITEIVQQRADGSFEVCVSDSRHFVLGVLTSEAVRVFGEEIDCEVRDIRGCYIVVNEFHYDFCYDRRKFLMHIGWFTYCGGECDTYGDPIDINRTYVLKSLAHSPLYTPFGWDDLFVHRAAAGGIGDLDGGGLCGMLCGCLERESLEREEHVDSEERMCVRTKYHPVAGRTYIAEDMYVESVADAVMSFGYSPGESGGGSKDLLDLCSSDE